MNQFKYDDDVANPTYKQTKGLKYTKDKKTMLITHISKLDTRLYPSIPKWSLAYIQAANLPGYYKTRTNTTIHITNSHNFSNVLITMSVFLVYLV